MADFIDKNKVEFSSISPFMKMGISLFQEELQQTGGNNNNNNIDGLSNLYFPGGLFVTDYMKNLREDETEEENDPSKMEVTENFDVFIDLVSNTNIKSNTKSSIKSNKKTKTKRSSVKKLKNI